MAHDGHEVTYLTSRQWPARERPEIPGIRVVGFRSQGDLYDRERRRLWPVLGFAIALWRHLGRHGAEYDVVHTAALSPWAALASASFARSHGYRFVLDWWEVWSGAYWRAYLGPFAGTAGWVLQRLSAQAPQQPIAFSVLHASRLRALGQRAPTPIVRGLLPRSAVAEAPCPADSLVVYAGRHIPEKQVAAIVPALALAREWLPFLRAALFGDGPDRASVLDAVRTTQLEASIDVPGFVSEETLAETLNRALCLILLSRREGYGLIVAEAAARGVPSIVLRHPDSAASELIVDGVNGVLCRSSDPREIASAILRIHDAGYDLRVSTLAWFRRNADTLTLESSLPRLLAVYRGNPAEGRRRA